MTTITPERRDAIERSGDVAIRVFDPESKAAYVLIRADAYERLRPSDGSDGPFSPEDAYPHTDEVFGPAGWDDPRMDAYDDYEKHRP